MATSIVLVHDNANFRERAAGFLHRAGFSIVSFTNPMAAMAAIEATDGYDTLITKVNFLGDWPNRISLALMLRMRHPGINVVFVGRAERETHTQGIGMLIPHPVNLTRLAEAIRTRTGVGADLETS
jgi:DNA-binding NtrC family response regulator